MTDRVYPSSKPKGNTNANTKTTTTTTPPNRRLPPPPNKTIPTTRPPYRPNPTTTRIGRRRNRSCACLCCFWSFLIITLLLLITAITGCIFYLLYHPHRPSFSLAALKIAEFKITAASDDTTRLTSNLNLTLSIKNPNKKITFYYNPITVICSSHDTIISKGTYPNSITSKPNNITIIHTPLHVTNLLLEPETVNKFRADLKRKSGLPLTLVLDTEARVNVETIKTKKIGIRIKCEGIRSLIPKGGHRNSSSVAANVDDAKCKLDLRIKIWKWTF